MIRFKNKLFIVLVIIILSVVIQLIRLNLIVSLSKSRNVYKDFDSSQSTDIDKRVLDEIRTESFLLLYDGESEESIELKGNLSQTMKQLKKQCMELNINKIKRFDMQVDNIIIAFSSWDKFEDMDVIFQYIYKGGNVLFATTAEDDDTFGAYYRKLGIYEFSNFGVTNSINFNTNIMIKAKGTHWNAAFLSNWSRGIRIVDSCIVHAEDERGNPLLWELDFGAGKIISFNGTILKEKKARGLFTGVISLLDEAMLYPIINSKVIFIDDFPSNFYYENDYYYKSFGKSANDFYRDLWWPEMTAGAIRYDVKYTGAFIYSYNDIVEPPFDEVTESNKNLLIYGRSLIKQKGEIAFHGYNHQSLATEGFIKEDLGYKPWDNMDNMVSAMKYSINYVENSFPYYDFKVYVPPSNILSPEGRTAVKIAFPELSVISGVYENNEYGDVYVQEFELTEDDIVEFPRLTSGSFSDNETLWNLINGITTYGVFSHFIHPDDLIDNERSKGLGWEDLLFEYNKLLDKVHKEYSWLKSMTASQAGEELKRYESIQPYIQHNENNIIVNCDQFNQEIYFILKTQKNILRTENCQYQSIDEDYYLIRAIESDFNIVFSP